MAPEPIPEDPGFWKEKPGANDLVIPPPANQPAPTTFPIFLLPFPMAHSTEAISDVVEQQPTAHPAPQQQVPTENSFILFTIDPITMEPLAVILSSTLFTQQAPTNSLSTTINDGSASSVAAERDTESLNLPSAAGSEVVTDDPDAGSLILTSTVDSVDVTANQETGSLRLFSEVDTVDVTANQDTGSLHLISEGDSEAVTVDRDTGSLNLPSGVDLEVLTAEQDICSLNLPATVESVDVTAQQDTNSVNLFSGVDLESTTGITTECLFSNVPLDEISASALSPEIGASNICPDLSAVNGAASPETKTEDNFTPSLALSSTSEALNTAT